MCWVLKCWGVGVIGDDRFFASPDQQIIYALYPHSCRKLPIAHDHPAHDHTNTSHINPHIAGEAPYLFRLIILKWVCVNQNRYGAHTHEVLMGAVRGLRTSHLTTLTPRTLNIPSLAASRSYPHHRPQHLNTPTPPNRLSIIFPPFPRKAYFSGSLRVVG